jgi:Peptidase S46
MMLAKTLAIGFVFSIFLAADEGIWLFDQFPKARVEKTSGFSVSDDFLHHLERASVRFNNGGSGSIVSPHGLLLTNHHVGQDCIQKLSTSEHDYMAGGFSAATKAEEKTCPDLEVDVLLRTSDVTAKVTDGIRTDHGGNSGSPTVDEKGELIGILFDGNLEGLENRYLYTEEQARSVHVASNAILEALKKVYNADWLLREVLAGSS